MRVMGRWLLYTFTGGLFLLAAFGGGDMHGVDDPGPRWRSVILSVLGLVANLVGFGLWWLQSDEGGLGSVWPGVAILAWLVGGSFVVAAWVSIARDLREERRHGRRRR